MGILDVKVACLMIATFICGRCQSNSDVRLVEYGNHTYLFHLTNKKPYEEAKKACEKNGSRLAEIYNQATDDFLRGKIKPNEWFLLGGKNPRDREVEWDSRKKRTFVGWVDGEPTSDKYQCISIQEDKWNEEPCDKLNRYICEYVSVNNLRISTTYVVAGESPGNKVICEAEALPKPTVEWKDDAGNYVNKKSTGALHQVNASGKAILNFANARSRDEGNYTCVARNQQRANDELSETISLKVPSTPTLVAIEPERCSSRATVKWKPSRYAVDTKHKILIMSTSNQSGIREYFNSTKNSDEVQEFEVRLQSWKPYTISVTPCPQDRCMNHYTAINVTVKFTEGIPGQVENLVVKLSGRQSCVITWDKPRDVRNGFITEYKIFINESIDALNETMERNISSNGTIGSTKTYVFDGTPNRTYRFGVQASTCGGEIRWSYSSCITPSVDSGGNNSMTTIIAAVCGGIVFLLLLVAVVLIKKWKFRKSADSSTAESATIETGQDMNMGEITSERVVSQDSPHRDNSEELIYQNQQIMDNRNGDSKFSISLEQLENVYNSLQRKKSAGFAEQFEELTRRAKQEFLPCQFSANPALKSKNRYKNILPFDATRVPIKDGYINACFIDGHERKKKFIATQGPLKKTVNDFWQMIFEQESTVIVMLAKCVEAGKAKCEKYWPDHGMTRQFGAISVCNVNEARSCGFVCRILKVVAQNQNGVTERIVEQYHFLKWPDHGFPITTSHILQMSRKVANAQERSGSKSPIIVHCSAGAGRTGTLIGYDILMNESKSTGKANVFECVAKMRRQRVEMVQNCNQYILVHKLLLETHLFGDTDIPGRQVPEKFSDPHYKTHLQKEHFENLSRVKPMGMLSKGTVVSAYDRTRVTVDDGNNVRDLLGASYVEIYDESSQVIVTKEPTTANLSIFWKLITTSCVKTILMVTEDKLDFCNYWDNTDITNDEITHNYAIRKLKVPSTNTPLTHIHLQLSSDNEEQAATKLNACITRMNIEFREAGGAALIHCKNGIGMSGVCCAIMNLIERLKVEDQVDVFRAVKDLRDCKKGIVESLSQYKLCHTAVLAYLQEFETYSNFK